MEMLVSLDALMPNGEIVCAPIIVDSPAPVITNDLFTTTLSGNLPGSMVMGSPSLVLGSFIAACIVANSFPFLPL
jgi:hypothetical protein